MKGSTRILAGLFAIVVWSALFVAGEFFLGGEDVFMDPGDDPAGFAELISGTGFAIYAALGVIGYFSFLQAALLAYSLMNAVPETKRPELQGGSSTRSVGCSLG